MELHNHSLSLSILKMTLLVYHCLLVVCVYTFALPAVSPGDYGAVTNEITNFTKGQMRATHTIAINQDDICEDSPNENFFSNIALTSGHSLVNVTRPRVRVIIDDSAEPECSKQTHTICHIP